MQGSDETATPESLLTKAQIIEVDEESYQAPRLFFHAQLSIKFIMLIIVQMPTIVGILTIISMMNTIYESLKAIKVYLSAFLVFSSSRNYMLS